MIAGFRFGNTIVYNIYTSICQKAHIGVQYIDICQYITLVSDPLPPKITLPGEIQITRTIKMSVLSMNQNEHKIVDGIGSDCKNYCKLLIG